MNKTKLALLFGIPALVFGVVALSGVTNQVFAQGMMRTAQVDIQDRGDSMIGANNQNNMVEMMKSVHGDSWQEECTNMMKESNDQSNVNSS